MVKTILIDTRQQANKHKAKHEWFEKQGVAGIRCALPFGDYCKAPTVSVDTKRDLSELCNCLDAEHTRFRRECQKAQDAGSQLIILTETVEVATLDDFALWQEADDDFYMRKAKYPNARRRYGKRFSEACRTMTARYGVRFEFCRPENAGQRVLDLIFPDESPGES